MNANSAKLAGANFLVAMLLLGGLAWLGWAALAKFDYRWDWLQPLQYMVTTDAEGNWRAGLLLKGFLVTLRLTLWGGFLCLLLGLGICLLRVSQFAALRMLGTVFVELIRNTPPLVFMFIMYFFVSNQLLSPDLISFLAKLSTAHPWLQFLFGPPAVLENFASGLLCIALYEAAYIAEIFRGGIQSIDRGQWEAGRALGLRRWRLMRLVILPQALRKVLPPTANQLISLVKDSSIISIISVQELTFAGIEVATVTGRLFETLLLIASLYFLLCWPVSMVLRRFETAREIPGATA